MTVKGETFIPKGLFAPCFDTICSDKEKNKVKLPYPYIHIDRSDIVAPEPCPQPVDITVEGCNDTVEIDAGDLEFE